MPSAAESGTHEPSAGEPEPRLRRQRWGVIAAGGEATIDKIWTTPGAEAVLRLRAVIANGDFDEYWQWHQQQELHRNHLDHYQKLDLAA